MTTSKLILYLEECNVWTSNNNNNNKPTKICSHLSPFKQPIVCYPEARCVTTGKQLSLQH